MSTARKTYSGMTDEVMLLRRKYRTLVPYEADVASIIEALHQIPQDAELEECIMRDDIMEFNFHWESRVLDERGGA